MKPLALSIIVLTGVGLVGCSKPATRTEFIRKDVACLRCYCASNAIVAEKALLELDQYARQCQKEGVSGILYDEVFSRIYGRLYLVEKQLGERRAAEHCLQKAVQHYQSSGHVPSQTGPPLPQIQELVIRAANPGFNLAWQNR
jgi:hypothetical protein